MRHPRFALACLASLAGFAASGEEKPSGFMVTTKRENDAVTVALEKGQTVIDVRSPFGISAASVRRNGGRWTNAVVIRVHSGGLEQFKVSAGTVGTELSVGSVGEVGVSQAAGPKDPLYVRVRAFDAPGKPAKQVPLKAGGYFELTLPHSLLKDNPKSIDLSWTDWFRR